MVAGKKREYREYRDYKDDNCDCKPKPKKREVEAYIGLEYEGDGPLEGEVSVELPISFELFIIAFIISQLE